MNFTKINSPINALKKLKQGNNIFLENKIKTLKVNLGEKEIQDLKYGQHPYAILITCSDSRISPNLIFNAGLSELFVIRTAGNVVDLLCIGSVEYALTELNVPLILVLGHEKCGAVKATLNSVQTGLYPKDFQKYIIKEIEPAIKKAICNFDISKLKENNNQLSHSIEDDCIIENIKLTIENLFKSNIVKEMVKQEKLMITGAKYDFNGKVHFLLDF